MLNIEKKLGATELWSLLAIAMIIFGARLNIIDVFSVAMPYWDDWGQASFLSRHIDGTLQFSDFISPSNQHRMMFTRLLAIGLIDLNQGQWDPVLAMIANSGMWTITALVLVSVAYLYRQHMQTPVIIILILLIWTFPISLVNTLWGIQSHNYFMILFAVLGCWLITYSAFSLRWWFGLICIFSACLTLAGGALLGLSVAFVSFISAVISNQQRSTNIITSVAALSAVCFGVMMILIEPTPSYIKSTFNLLNSVKTIGKSMSWPLTNFVWPSLIIALPILLILLKTLMLKQPIPKVVRYILSVYGFILLVSISIGIARASGGHGPSRRYFEFLSLAYVMSMFSLLLVQLKYWSYPKWLLQSIVFIWILILLAAIPWQIEVLNYTLNDRQKTRPPQEANVRMFINTHDYSWLKNKPFRHIPFHDPNLLGDAIIHFQKLDMLPYHLQYLGELKAPDLNDNSFIVNGSIDLNTGDSGGDFNGEQILGSYSNDGEKYKTGLYVSQSFNLSRDFIMIPISGNLGNDGTQLDFVNIETNKRYPVSPESSSENSWRAIFIKAPPGDYEIHAQDQSNEHWFAFATPRSVGRLSYYSIKLLDRGSLFWKLGILLLLLVNLKSIVRCIRIREYSVKDK